MEQKYLKYIFGIVLAFLMLQLVLIPFISHQTAKRTVEDILKNWISGDPAMSVKNFTDPNASPPIYNLKSYKIKSHKFESVNGKSVAKFWVILEFGPDNVFPSGKTWLCELNIDKGRWLAASFKPTND